MPISRRAALGGCALGALLLAAGCSTDQQSRTTLDAEAEAALTSLYGQVPPSRALVDRSAAVLVFPSVTQAGLGVGGQYGRGVLFEDGRPTGYYNVTGGSFGLQIGAQSFSQAYVFTTEEALRTFRETEGFEVGAGLDFAVADVGTTGQISSSTLQKPVVVFVWGQQGLMAGVSVEGQKITELASE
ncbi:YSC84-related protein [Marinivivus vitaminiproducens]|uniref:lipid-binding SYLF domain-containing protein n=1 Tax=Marinivivus vitaminiproducens TaxID=3035935 RepID=UPI002799F2BA|nr:lipid-binding SYLF domain-containing protein [Geminicoccaceae bacterium SCSIO 64248]